MRNEKLWEKIDEFHPGGEQAALFVQKLQTQTEWSHDYCVKVITEYKKFLYLGTISDKPVTPSPPVDLVWHLHLTFTRDYWSNLCEQIIGKAFHHDPEDSDNAAEMRDQYLATLALYKEEFGDSTTSSLCPILIRPRSRALASWGSSSLCLLLVAVLYGYNIAAEGTVSALSSMPNLLILILLLVAVISVLGIVRYVFAGRRRKSMGSPSPRHSQREDAATSSIIATTTVAGVSSKDRGNGTGSAGSSSCSGDGGGSSCSGGGSSCGGGCGGS